MQLYKSVHRNFVGTFVEFELFVTTGAKNLTQQNIHLYTTIKYIIRSQTHAILQVRA